MSRNQFIEQVHEVQDKTEQENRGVLNSPLYPRTRAKQQNSMAMQENETSVMSIPRNRNSIDFEKEVEAYSPRKPEEQDIAQ